MTANNDPDDRRSFTSRTPVNDNPDQVQYRRGFVTRHQVSGWRFVMRRIASGIALHDTRMLVDPLRTQSRAVAMGAVLLVTGLAGCFVFSLIRPNGTAGTNAVLADRSTAALYVRVGDDLHPVLNLTSARLIVGKPVNPITVKSAELDRFPRGNLLGIPGAPERMVQNPSTDANWTVCDSVSEPAPGGHGAHSTGVTVIAGRPDSSGARAAALPSQQAILAERDGGTWLLWNGRRSQINLADHAVTNALGLTENNSELPAPRPIALGLFNAIPEAPSLSAPGIPNAGAPAPFAVPAPIGAVVVSYTLDQSSSGAPRYYAVLPDGLQQISPVLAAILRNTNSYGLDQPPRLGADAVAKLPVSRMLDTARYPDQHVSLVDTAKSPVTCAYWSKPAGAATSSLNLLSGSALPIAESIRPVDLVGGGSPQNGPVATRVALPPGTGYFTQTAGGGAGSPGAGSLFWVSDTGVRYGIDNEAEHSAAGHGKTVEALGLSGSPLPIPWSVLSLFAKGPTLSRADALLAHDGLPPDQAPGRVAAAAPQAEGAPR
ncbi:type VII secretion protein EccB [Mycobacterium avium]|uniref:ESX-3 secretion system protein eccB3 n=1 Tax=Mycobacterium avium subsp. hominissuis TaxID=439334 RepID=A0AAI8X522_MYCAV|nr:type VII secretion protein EccB [Mycobacterium avium]ATO69251.1 type VII secretion protein EccB [Mycobacterium avium subsp. hominissuis]MBG0726925.1 type VII secretion protein EccB [Mycobacterium avium]MBZ4581591.1 type VII secretion protein EccB [Mycobacterium avium subsp. hominissuis]MCA2291548.1 type VII secretion protein EccB [Mycobacterium avium]MCA2364579.1 type VII secretion protein EccB [Mycobacterium avium]